MIYILTMKIGGLAPGASVGTAFSSLAKGLNQDCEIGIAHLPVSKLLGKDSAEVERGGALNLDALVSRVLVAHLQHIPYLDHAQLMAVDDKR